MPTAIAYDTETTGLRPYEGARMFAYSTCAAQGGVDVVRLDGSPLRAGRGMRALRKLWADQDVPKVMHNAKFDLTMTEIALGRKLDGHEAHCTHKMSHILQNHHHGHTLENLSWELGNYPRVDGEIKRLARESGGFHKVPEHRMTEYQRADAVRGMFLYLFFWPRIKANPRWLDCYREEMKLIWTTMRMEARGIFLRRDHTHQMIRDLHARVDAARESLFAYAGYRFNPASDAEIRKLLYRKLGMPVIKRTAKAGKESTDKFVLMELRGRSPAIDLILQIRSYTKGAALLDDYLQLAENDGAVHPTINTCGAITGRESSERPNMQNVQKAAVLLNPFPVPAREVFRARPGYVNLLFDYSGIEMRLLIHYSGDPRMAKCLKDGDGDVHALAAEVFYGDRFTSARGKHRKMLRAAAKGANFACPYGAGEASCSKSLGISGREGASAYARYKRTFPKLLGLSREIAQRVRADGHVETAFGRRLHAPVSKAYVGINYLIQGTAAEILKRAQNRVHEYNVKATGNEVKILLPVHDEIMVEYPRKRLRDLPGYLGNIKKMMTDFTFDVPLDVDVSAATTSWADARPLVLGGRCCEK